MSNTPADVLDQLRAFMRIHRDSSRIPDWEGFANDEFHKTLLSSMRKFVNHIKEKPDSKKEVELTEKMIDLYIECYNRKELVYSIFFQGLFQMLCLGTVPGMIATMAQYVNMITEVSKALYLEEQKSIIKMN